MKKRDDILPANFQEHYKNILGEKDAEKFFQSSCMPLRKSLRVNTLKYSVDEFSASSKEKNWDISPTLWCSEGFFLERKPEDRSPIGLTPDHLLGGIYIQEASSQIPPEALFWGHEDEDFSKKIVLDIASSPGSKTTQIAAKMRNEGTLIANEFSSSRIKALHSNLERCGISNTILTHYEGANLCSLLPEAIDFILLDAPCTGEGTVRKNYDALKNWQLSDAKNMGEIQKKLIFSAFKALKEGGEMVYSTCTLAREENSDVVNALLEKFSESVEIVPLGELFPGAEKVCTKEGFLQVWPHVFDTEGFFVAKIRKKNSEKNEKNFKKGKIPFEKLSRKKSEEVEQFFEEKWGYFFPKNLKNFWKKDEKIWLFPPKSEEIFPFVKCDRIGVPILEIYKKNWNTTHEAAICFGKNFTKNTFSISQSQVKEVFEGKDLILEKDIFLEKQSLAMYENFTVALGKNMPNGKWKNNLPRSIIKR